MDGNLGEIRGDINTKLLKVCTVAEEIKTLAKKRKSTAIWDSAQDITIIINDIMYFDLKALYDEIENK